MIKIPKPKAIKTEPVPQSVGQAPAIAPDLDAIFTKQATGFHSGMAFSDYLQLPAINASLLKSPTAFEMYHSIVNKKQSTGFMMRGNVIHHAILEPHVFASDEWKQYYQEYTATKGLDTKAAKEAMAADPTRTLLTPEMLDQARRCRDAVWKHKEAARLLEMPGQSEVTATIWDEDFQCMRKIRVDRLPNDTSAPLIDLKSTSQGVDEHSYRRTIYNFEYDIQAAFYQDGAAMLEKTVRPYFHITVSTTEPPIARVFHLAQGLQDYDFIERGRKAYLERMASFALAYHEGKKFGAYEDEGAHIMLTSSVKK